MKLRTIFIATLLSISTISQAKDAEDEMIVKYDIEFGTVGELKTQVAAMYGLINLKALELSRQAAIDAKTEKERDLNNCIEILTNSVTLSGFEHVAEQSDRYVQDQIKELSLNDYTDQTKAFCKENIDEVSEIYIQYLDEIFE